MSGFLKGLFRGGRDRRNVRECGSGNVFVNLPAETRVVVFGDGNRVEFAEPGMHFGSWIHIGAADFPVHGAKVVVGRGTTSEECRITLMEHGSEVRIGEDCMISTGVELLASDTHALKDAQGRIVNRSRGISIGDHVWLCRNAAVLKNSEIPSGSVVGYGAVVCGLKGLAAGSMVAGNPARVVREGAAWSRERPDAGNGGGRG